MPRNLMRATSGELSETSEVTGPNSYQSGGFTISTDVGRVDEASIEVSSDDTWIAQVTDTNTTSIIATVRSMDSGNEAANDTDLSAVEFTYTAHRL